MVSIDEVILYESPEGAVSINVIIDTENETLWATQKTIAELFDKSLSTVSEHLNNIFESEELNKDEVKFNPNDSGNSENVLIINPEAKTQPILYNLDVIISVGYRVNSKKATQFRKWSTSILREYIQKGFVIDKELLMNEGRFGKDYFDELLEIIKEIRASQRKVYQKITDLFAECSYDHNSNSQIARDFYAQVQNKLHYAVTGKTAAELIYERAECNEKNMGLTNWKNSPHGRIIKTDVAVAKNYLNEDEIKALNRIVNMYLDYAEDQAERHKPMSMADWANKLDAFLKFNEYDLLGDKGKVSSFEAKIKAELEFEEYRKKQDKTFVSDYDKLVELIEANKE